MGITRVLIADDHPVYRQGLAQFFNQQADIQVIAQASNGEEAIQLAQELKPEVVIMDIVLPGINGIEAIREIKKTQPDIAILALSAYDHEAYMVASLQAGASGYMLKNASVNDLIEAVHVMRDGGLVFKVTNFNELLRKAQILKNGDVQTPNLPAREVEVVRLVARGMSNHDISVQLKISESTVEYHLGRIFRRLKLNSRTELVYHALRAGWISDKGLF